MNDYVEYFCIACGFISKWVQPRTHYKCPSCEILVQAVLFEDGIEPDQPSQVVADPSPMTGVVDIEKFLKTKES